MNIKMEQVVSQAIRCGYRLTGYRGTEESPTEYLLILRGEKVAMKVTPEGTSHFVSSFTPWVPDTLILSQRLTNESIACIEKLEEIFK